MARKLQITQEMEDALRKANVPEESIAELREKEVDTDVEKLDLDSLDGVSGGGSLRDAPEDWRCPTFYNMTWPEAADLVEGFYNEYGSTDTIDICENLFPGYNWENPIYVYGPRNGVLRIWSLEYDLTH